MAYEIDLPDGSRGLIHDNVPRSKALEAAQRAYPDAFPPPPTALGQALNAPKNILRGAASGIVSTVGGITGLGHGAARYLNPEMTPFAETGFGKKITETEQSLAPTDEGYGSQLSHGLGSFLSFFGPQAIARGIGTAGRFALAPKAATPLAVVQTSGLGAEEARNRVEAARAEGKTVTPGEELGAMVAGVPAGLTELIPVQKIFKATKGLDTALTKGIQTAGFEGVKNFGKRALQQAGIEAAQEAGSGAIQDVIAQQIYNPEQEIGGSALKEAALGGGVGAIAQLGLDLALRKDIKRAYQISQKKKSDEDLAKQMEEIKAETAKKRAETDAALGISPLLALPAPKEQMTPSQAKHPIYNPLGNFSEGDLDPANILAINAKRAEENKPKLKSFSIEDLADSGMSQADISGLVAKKTGYAGTEADAANIPQHINDVLSLAAEKNVDPNSQGFKDFLRRATGLDDLQGMSAPQLFSAYTAVYRLPDSTTPQELHPGTSATRFSEGQYDTTIKNLNAAHPEDNALTLDDTISQIKEHSGLKNDTDAESLLHTAIRRGDLFAKAYPAPDGTTSISVHVPNANKEAGPDIRKSSVESGIQPESYVIKSSAGAIEEHPTQDAADARVAALTVARQAQADRSLKAAAALSKETDKAQTVLDAMAARGESNTLAFQQKASEVAAKTQANQAKAETLNNTAASLVEPLVVEPKGQQITTKDVHTVYEGNQPIAAFDTAEKAQAHALSRLPEEELQKYTGKLGEMAQNEIAQRQRKEPGISIIQTGGKEKAEEVLLSAGIFTGRFKQKAEELDRHLRPLMSRLGLGDLRLNIAHAIESGGADGKYAQKVISIALDAKNPIRVLRHEGIHALKELGFFTKEQWRILENKAKSEWVKKYNIPERYADLNVDEQLEEAIADAFSDFDQTKPPAGLIGVLFNKLKTFMEALSNAIEGLGFDTHSSIFGRVSSGGEMAPIKPVITERVSVGRKRESVADAPEAPVEVAAPLPVAKPAIKTIETKGTAVRAREGKPEKVGSGAYKLVKDATGYKFKLLSDTFEGEFSTEGKQPAQISSTKQISMAKPEPVAKEEESKPVKAEPVVKVEKPTVNKSAKMKKLAKARKVILSADTMNEAIIKMGGINVSLRPDLTGDKKGNQNLPFVGSLFSKNGTTDLSDLALNLGQYGYFTPEETEGVDGGARLLADRLRGEFDGGSPHLSMENMDDAADAALYKKQEEEKELFEAAQALAKKRGEEFVGAVDPDVLDVVGIPVTPEALVNEELLARAIAISPEKVDEIADLHQNSIESFYKAIDEFIKEQRNAGIETDGGEIFGGSEAGGTQVQGNKVPSTYEGEFTEITDKQKAMLSAPVSKLNEEQTVTLENHYGEDRNTPAFFARIQADVITFAAKGKQAISAAIRSIIAQIHAGVLAVAMIVNPSFVSQQNDVVVYSAPVVSEQLKVPAEAKTNMSDAALEAYEALYPKIKNDLLARDNFMLIMDKPNARMFVFNPDGSLFLQKKVLVGKDIGDLYTGTGKHTPAGLFTLGLRDASRSTEEAKTAGAYKHGKVFVLDKALGGEASVTILHSVWTKEKDAQQRVAALKKEGGEDSRYSFGCINVDADTYNGLVTRNLKQMDGASLFIVPDNQKQVKEFLAGTNVKDSLTRAKFSRRQTETPAFKQWFGKSKAVNADGTPKVYYHGTAQDISKFKPKRAEAIFLTEDPEFAEDFAALSAVWMSIHSDELLSPKHQAELKVIREKIYNDPKFNGYLGRSNDGLNQNDVLNEATKEFVLDKLNSGENIMPLYVRAENTFDYENPAHIEIIKPIISKRYADKDESVAKIMQAKYLGSLKKGDWETIETPDIQKAIKAAGFDSFYAKEAGRKNLAVYKENQVKSAVGNTGEFSRSKDDVRYSRRAGYAPSAMQGAAQPMSALDEAVNRTTTVRKTAGLAQRIAEAISPTGFTRARQAFINKYEAIENLTRDVAKRFGDAESFADVSAIAAALFSDRAAGVAASSFMNGIPKYQNGFTKVSDEVRGLIPILEPLMKPGYPQNILQLFQFYAGTRRGSRLLYEQKMDANGNLVSTSREYNFTKEDIALGNSLERQYPEFKTVFAEYQQYNNGLVQFMKDTGVISAKEAELWTKNWDYIPFYRQMDGERISAPSIFSSIAGVTKPKELKGGEAPLADFLETVVRNARAAIEAGMKNVAGQRVVRDIVKIGQGEEVPAGTAGLDIVTVKEAGVTKYYRVNDPLLVESLRGLNLPNLPFVDILAAPANFLRSMVTKDPGYMMANMMRDSMQAWVTSGANITPILDTFKQYGKVISGQSPEAKALSDAGLFSGYDFSGDTKSSAKEVEKELRKRTGKRTILQTALLPGAKVWEMLDKGSHASDVATRAEIYKRTMESTGGNEAEALYQALEIMNFSRKGNSAIIRIVTALVPFMNARIQGMDVLYRTGFGKSATANREAQQKAFITRSMTMFALSMMYWMLASDTEEYKTATQEERDNNWIVAGAKIPIPFELGVMFKVFPERMLEHFFGTDTGEDLKKSAIRNLTSTLVMNPIPHVFVPIIEHVADYSFFTGQEIVGKGMEGLATRYQAQPGTSLLAKTVGKETGASPVVLDNYIRGYTGTIGTYIVMAIDAIMHGEGDDIKASKRLEQMPVFRRFMSNKLGSGTVNAYYDLKKEVETSTRTINYLERQGRMEDMAEYLKGRGGKLQTIKPYIQELEKDMDGLRDFRRDVRIAKIPADRLAEIEDAIRVSEINLTRNIQTIKKAIE
jgi:hypothetical protein